MVRPSHSKVGRPDVEQALIRKAVGGSGLYRGWMAAFGRCVARISPLLLLGAGLAQPPTADAASVARRIEARLNEIGGFVASFTQTLESPALPSPQVEKGTVYLLRPGRMRWEYEDPPGKLALADGERTYLYLPDERRVLVAPMPGPGEATGMSVFLGERFELLEEFSVAWGRPSGPGGAAPLVLTPRAAERGYDRLLIEPDDDLLIRVFTIVDPLGGRVTYRFGRPRVTRALDAELFRFEAPEGVEVQDITR